MFLLVALWLFLPFAVDVSVPAVEAEVDHDHDLSSPEMSEDGSSPSTASTSSSTTLLETAAMQSRRSTSLWCFATRGGGKKKGAASANTTRKGGDVISMRPVVDEEHKRRRKISGMSPSDARSGNKASESGSSSPASSMFSPSPGGRTWFTGAERGSISGTHARCPGKQEAKGGGGMRSYIREISKQLSHFTAEKTPLPPPPPTRTVVSLFGEQKRGNAIASEEEIRAFVLASAKTLKKNGPPSIPMEKKVRF